MSKTQNSSFRCTHCGSMVSNSLKMGTSHRNHCNHCLWSRHVDNKPGDRRAACGSDMEPIGVTLKIEGHDKYSGEVKYGDVMLIHRCQGCGKININRIAADDNLELLLNILDKSNDIAEDTVKELQKQNINFLSTKERDLVTMRLYGK